MLKTKSELLTYITNGKMEESLSIRFLIGTVVKSLYLFVMHIHSQVVTLLDIFHCLLANDRKQKSKKWILKSFHQSNADTTILALALEKAGLLIRKSNKGRF